MDLLLLEGEVDEFKDIMGIINKEMDLVSLRDENLRRAFMIFKIAGGVVNGQTKPVTEADAEQLWCSSVDGMVAVAKQVIDYAREMTFQELDGLQKQAVLEILRSACNIISKQFALDSSLQGLLEELQEHLSSTTGESLVGIKTENQGKERDTLPQASSISSISWPRNGRISLEWVQVLISTFKWSSWKDPKEFRNVMPVTVVKKLIIAASKIMRDERNCVKIRVREDSEVIVVGDIRGRFHDLITLFEGNAGFPSDHRYFIFNGNYVDKSSWSLEVLLVLLAWKILMPHRVYLLRGNHETKDFTLACGFWAELCTKFGKKDCKVVYDKCLECFRTLPLASIIAHSVYTTHGGLFRSRCSASTGCSTGAKRQKLDNLSLGSLKEFAKVNRFLEDLPENGLLSDALWSDPSLEAGLRENTKKFGLLWGPDYTEEFLSENRLKLIIRSHEGPDARTGQDDERKMLNGYSTDHDVVSGKLYTLFTAPSYLQVDGFDNIGAYAVLKPPHFDSPLFLPLKAAKRPEVPPSEVFNYEDLVSDEGEDSRLTDSDEEMDLALSDGFEQRDSSLMVTNVELNKKLQDQAEKIRQLESTVEVFLKERDDRSKRIEEMMSNLLRPSARRKRRRGNT